MKRLSGITLFTALSAAAGTLYLSLSILAGMPGKPKPAAGKRLIACIGDSITFGAGVKWTRNRDSYPALLETKLGRKYQTLNYGISGATLQRCGDRPYTKSGFWEFAKASKPDIYLFMLGTNDSKPCNWNAAVYKKELGERLLELMSVNKGQRVFVMIPPAAFPGRNKKTVPFDIRAEIIRNEIRGIIEDTAKKYGAGIIDLYSLTESHPEYFKDGVHPNRMGNKAIASAVYRKIQTT